MCRKIDMIFLNECNIMKLTCQSSCPGGKLDVIFLDLYSLYYLPLVVWNWQAFLGCTATIMLISLTCTPSVICSCQLFLETSGWTNSDPIHFWFRITILFFSVDFTVALHLEITSNCSCCDFSCTGGIVTQHIAI